MHKFRNIAHILGRQKKLATFGVGGMGVTACLSLVRGLMKDFDIFEKVFEYKITFFSSVTVAEFFHAQNKSCFCVSAFYFKKAYREKYISESG